LGTALLDLGYDEVWGIEPDETAALAAGVRLSRVIQGSFPTQALKGAGQFDLILFADSLEHILDPWTALAEARHLLARGGLLVLSVPNVGHYSVIWQLLRGRWEYREQGLLDITHMRFFTPRSLRDALTKTGFAIAAETAIVQKPGPRYALAVWLVARFWPHVFVYQNVVVAESHDDARREGAVRG
jgi:2-polyprenyl-3-methyl-5-hydroxy-6-metoxy-1,4-benzoquinol methylase